MNCESIVLEILQYVMLANRGSHHLRGAATWISTSIHVAGESFANGLRWWRGGRRPSGLEEFKVLGFRL